MYIFRSKSYTHLFLSLATSSCHSNIVVSNDLQWLCLSYDLLFVLRSVHFLKFDETLHWSDK